jgi:hypothetical protein
MVVSLFVVRGPEWDHDLRRIFLMQALQLEDFEQIATRDFLRAGLAQLEVRLQQIAASEADHARPEVLGFILALVIGLSGSIK